MYRKNLDFADLPPLKKIIATLCYPKTTVSHNNHMQMMSISPIIASCEKMVQFVAFSQLKGS